MYIFSQRLHYEYDFDYVSADVKAADGSAQTLVTLKTPQKCRRSADEEEDEEELFKEQNYVEVLYAGSQGEHTHTRH